MKRFILILLTLSLILLVSCGNGENQTETGSLSMAETESSASSTIESLPEESSNLSEESSKEPESAPANNIAPLGSYTIHGFYTLMIDDSETIPYPDEDGITLTDGKLPATNNFYDEALTGLCNSDEYKEKGYHYIDFTFEEAYEVNKFKIYVVPSTESNQGVCSPDVEIYASNDGEAWSAIAAATPKNELTEGFENYNLEVMEILVEKPTEASQYQLRFKITKGWMFLAEVEIFV